MRRPPRARPERRPMETQTVGEGVKTVAGVPYSTAASEYAGGKYEVKYGITYQVCNSILIFVRATLVSGQLFILYGTTLELVKKNQERMCSAHAGVLHRFHVSLRAGLQEELVEVEPEQQLRQVR